MGDPQCSRLQGKGSSYSKWGALLARALEEAGDTVGSRENPLLILGGDIVNRGNKNRQEEWSAFFEAQEEAVCTSGSTNELLMVTPVNGAEESIGVYTDKFINPGNGPVGHEKEFFSFDHGCCHFIVLNSDYMGNTGRDAYKYIGAWIRADLAVNRKPVVFAVMHHPAYTLGTSFEDDVRAAAIRDNYMKLLYRYGVDFILCGHQHAYARTAPTEEENHVTQIMGVSGGKHFDARDKSNMAVVSELVSVATLFETDGETISLRTIDRDGNVLDEYMQDVRPPKKRKCGTCDRFSECRGTGKFELLEAEEKARKLGDPLKPANEEGVSVNGVCFSDKELENINTIDVEYSVMRKGSLEYETKRGFRIGELFEKTGITRKQIAERSILVLTDSRGRQKMLPLGEVMNGRCFSGTSSDVVPAIIFAEEGKYRLAYGQQDAAQYNGRGWMWDVRQIEIR